ncbi:MAG: penicillin-binding protein 2 [Peptococcaceae bacterium]|nr:MAG: penicillin-binding protein 2 [Peptococcaceae bacterium]
MVGYFRQERLVQAFYFFLLLFIFLLARLCLIQVKNGDKLAFVALEQDTLSVVLEDIPRGRILDRNLEPLTDGNRSERVVIFPRVIEDKAEVAAGLAGVLGVEQVKITRALAGDPKYLPYPLSGEQARFIRERGWSGVMALPVYFRYGSHSLAVQVMGHLGSIFSAKDLADLNNREKFYRLNDLVGKTGLEKYYDYDLKATRPEQVVRVFIDAGGRVVGGPVLDLNAGDPGRRDLVLTVDANIQRAVENVMDDMVIKGAVVVMEVGTGDILAIASRPSFNPERVEDFLDRAGNECFLDRATALYQPGSVFKVVVAAAALEEGIVSPADLFFCRGEKEDLLRCWYAPGHGTISFARAFAESCNPTFARVTLRLTPAKLIAYARQFGFASQAIAGYPFPADRRQDLSLIGLPNNLVNSSIGQGPVLATPVQVAAMINAIASDGMYSQPRLVKELRQSNGKIERQFPADKSRVISSATARELKKLLALVTAEGTGKDAYLPVCGSAGKTGTAQVTNSGQKVNTWFAGYAPLASPRFVITVLVEEGAGGRETAAQVFSVIAKKILAGAV